jgi:hypothetical protein
VKSRLITRRDRRSHVVIPATRPRMRDRRSRAASFGGNGIALRASYPRRPQVLPSATLSAHAAAAQGWGVCGRLGYEARRHSTLGPQNSEA